MTRFVPGLLCAAALSTIGMPEAPAQSSCDRACLGAMLDRYLDAVVADDPGSSRDCLAGLENFNKRA
jgi:hypothetical protein